MSFKSLFEFESALSEYTGAPYVVLTDGCTHAIKLCMLYDMVNYCKFTAFTYVSIPMTLHTLSIGYELTDEIWNGEYQFHHTRIWDSARRLEPRMYRPGQFQCLSFGYSKPLELGKCGAILTDDVQAYHTLSKMRSDGRDLTIDPWEDQIVFKSGYHYCPTLETCERGITMLRYIKPQNQTVAYPDCRKITFKY